MAWKGDVVSGGLSLGGGVGGGAWVGAGIAASLATCADSGGKSGGLNGEGNTGLRVMVDDGPREKFDMVSWFLIRSGERRVRI